MNWKRWKETIPESWHDLVHLFHPRRCPLCGKMPAGRDSLLCLRCFGELPRTYFEQYSEENPTEERLREQIPVDHAYSLLFYSKGNPAQRLILALKYGGHKEIAFWLGRLAGRELLRRHHPLCDNEVLVPVPIHARRLRERGYNQAEWIARGIQSVWHCPIDTVTLHRTRFQTSQTNVEKQERWENVKDSFVVREPGRLEGKKILLVDDVITTGATACCCAEALSQVKAARVHIFSVALAGHL